MPPRKSCICNAYSTFPKKKTSDVVAPLYSAKVLEEHDVTHRYLKQTRYSKSLDHFNFSKESSYCASLYNISDFLNNTTRSNKQNGSNVVVLNRDACNCYKCERDLYTSIDLNVSSKKCQKLVKSLSHTPSESNQHIFKSNSMQVLSPKFKTHTNGFLPENYETSKQKEKEEQATIKKLIEMGETSSESSTASLIKKNKSLLTVVDVVTLRKVRSATCLGEDVSSVMLSGTESLPNIATAVNENLRYIDVINYSSSSSTCTSERSGWVSSRSSSVTSLETNKSNGIIRSWSGIEKKLQSLSLSNGRGLKRYQRFIRDKGWREIFGS